RVRRAREGDRGARPSGRRAPAPRDGARPCRARAARGDRAAGCGAQGGAQGRRGDMIVWLASYPRSGNTLLRTVLYQTLGCGSCSAEIDPDVSESIAMSEAAA